MPSGITGYLGDPGRHPRWNRIPTPARLLNTIVFAYPHQTYQRMASMISPDTTRQAFSASQEDQAPAGPQYNLTRARLASFAFLLPYFVSTVTTAPLKVIDIPTRFLEYAILAVLIIEKIVSSKSSSRRGGFALASFFAILVCIYALFRAQPVYGTSNQYLAAGLAFVVIYGFGAVYAGNLFEPRVFVDVFWKLSIASLWIALTAFAFSKVFGGFLLVSVKLDTGIGRMQGLLSEPSAWAPVLAAILLLSIRRRSWFNVALSILGVIVVQSPTVYITMIISLVGYYLITTAWRKGKPLALLLVASVSLLIAGLVRGIDTGQFLKSHNPIEHAIGRTLDGIANVTSGGTLGDNARFTYVQVVIGDIQANGWTWFGYGPNSSSVFFPAKYLDYSGLRPLGPASIWNRAWFEFGLVGMAVLLFGIVIAVLRSSKSPLLAAVLLPFVLSSCINGASGHQLYKLVELAILLFACNWIARTRPFCRAVGPVEVGTALGKRKEPFAITADPASTQHAVIK